MRRKVLVGMVCLGLKCLCLDAGVNRWSTAGPEGGEVNAVAVGPDGSLYAATNGGMFRSTDSGGVWTWASRGLDDPVVFSVAADPFEGSRVYAGTLAMGVFKSTDAGGTWARTISVRYVFSIATDPANRGVVYAGGLFGILKSTDAGDSWVAIGNGTLDNVVRSVVLDPQSSTILYASTDGAGLFKSTDAGESWRAANTGLPASIEIRYLRIDLARPQNLYLAPRGGYGIYKSTDAGQTWDRLDARSLWWFTALLLDEKDPSVLYAGATPGVVRSTDGGASWTVVYIQPEASQPLALVPDPKSQNSFLVVTEAAGIFKGRKDGSSWERANNGLTGVRILSLAVDPSTSGTVYARSFGGLHKTADGALSWRELSVRLRDNDTGEVAIRPGDPRTVYAITGGFFYKSTDAGETWAWKFPECWSCRSLAVDPLVSGTVYLAGSTRLGVYGVFASTDAGETWSGAATLPGGAVPKDLYVDPLNRGVVYSSGVCGGLFKSTDAGATWGGTAFGLASVRTAAIDPVSPGTLWVFRFLSV